MARSSAVTFADPQLFQVAIRPAQVEMLVTAKGSFHAKLTRIELPRIWLQRGSENLPRVVHTSVRAERPPIFFQLDADQAPMSHEGTDVPFGEIVASGSGAMQHHRTVAPCRWGTLSLTGEDLATAGHAILGRELTVPAVTGRLRPSPPLMARLLSLHKDAEKLANTEPHIFAQPETTRALEQALMHAMIMCLTDGTPVERGAIARKRSAIIARLEDLLAANHEQPLYLAEICTAVGASERTLHICCHEHLGMGPVRYLWLRRMHLARRALLRADPATASVTGIAMDHGFWELGRFAVKYHELFGEMPSASLRQPPDDRRTWQDRPLAVPVSESA